MASRGLRVGVVGATGALGNEVLRALASSPLRVSEIIPIGTDRSLGSDIEFQGEVYPVETEMPSLRGIDLLLLCAPPSVSLDCARQSLRAEVPCIDLSGALAGSAEVPLSVGELKDEWATAPLIAVPPGAALAWALVLRPLDQSAGLVRVAGTSLEGASVGGRRGIDSLYAESLAIFNQTEAPEPSAFPRPLAFDCLPSVGPASSDGATEAETRLADTLARHLGARVQLTVTSVQVPVFVGHGAVLAIETQAEIDLAEAATVLDKAPGVEVADPAGAGPSMRAAVGRDVVLVGRLRRDPSRERCLLLWLAADLLRLSASHAVELSVARLLRH